MLSARPSPAPAPSFVAAAVTAGLRPLLQGWPRVLVLGMMGVVAVVLGLQYVKIGDNNSVAGMLSVPPGEGTDGAIDPSRYYLESYVGGFGDDDAIFIAFETNDALSPETAKLLATVQRALEEISVPFEPSGGSTEDGSSTYVASWPWRRADASSQRQSPPSLIECLTERDNFGVTYDECLRRILGPVKVEVVREDGDCFIAPLTQWEGREGQEVRQELRIPLDCRSSAAPRLRLMMNTLSYVDYLPFFPGDEQKDQLGFLRGYLEAYGNHTRELDGRALPMFRDALIGGANSPYTTVGVLGRLTDFHERDDLRSVATSWIRDSLQAEAPGIKFHLLGGPVILGRNTHEVAVTHLTREPLIAVILFAFLGYLYRRRPRLLLIPIATAVMSMVTTMGLYAWYGGTYNWVVSILPIIIVVTSVSDSIHLIGFYVEKSASCVIRESAFERTIYALLTPCFYTSFTTAVGLFSLYYFAAPGPFRDFGFYGTIGVTVAFMYSFLLFAMLAPPVENLRSALPDGTLVVAESAEPRYSAWLVRWCEVIVIVSGVLIFAGLIIAGRITWNFDSREWYTDEVDVTKDVWFAEKRMHGSNSFAIQVEPGLSDSGEAYLEVPATDYGGKGGTIYLTDGQIKALWGIRDRLLDDGSNRAAWAAWTIEDSGLSWLRLSPSILDLTFAHRDDSADIILGRVRCALNGGKLSLSLQCIPAPSGAAGEQAAHRRRVVIEQLHMLFNLDEPQPEHQGRRTRSIILARQGNNEQFREMIHDIQDDLDDICPVPYGTCKARATGFMPICSEFFGKVLTDMLRSFLLAIALVCATMFMLLGRRPWLAVLSLLPNIIPFILVTALMTLMSIPIYYATMMLAAVAMGLVVDDTIQFTHALNREFEGSREMESAETFDRSASFRQAVARALDTAGRAMINTSLSLMAGFAMLTIGQFRPTDDVGTVLVLIIFVALLCDVFLFPALLLWLGKSAWFLRLVYRVRR